MKIGQNIQCEACGASSVSKLAQKPLLECEYCGAMMTFNDESKIISTIQSQHQSTKLGLLLVLIPVLVIVLLVVFWLVFQNTRDNKSIAAYSIEVAETIEANDASTNLAQEVVKEPSSVTEITQSVTTDTSDQLLSIESQISGETSNGGKYWIFGLINSSDQLISRPGVMLSIFNQEGKRIEEQGGWSLRDVLEPGEQTVVLLFLSDPPADAAAQQITTLGSTSGSIGLSQVEIAVLDYSISHKNKQFELVGDVINDQNNHVKYVRVIVVAYDAQGKPIGIGNSFSTDKELAPNQRSGFKVKVGTFLQGEPVNWRMWALGRQQ